MRLKLLFITILLASCSNAKEGAVFPKTLEEECRIAGPKSGECKLLNSTNLSVGDKEAALGMLYLYGNAKKSINYERALYWINQAASNNNAEALNILGVLYYSGTAVEKNFQLSEKYYLLAISNGEKKNSKINLAELYRSSQDFGLPINYGRAEKWYLEAITESPLRANEGLSKLYDLKNDYKKAFFYAEKAAKLGSVESQYNLGVYYRDGIYVDKDIQKARYWFTLAANQGYQDAINNLK